MEEVGCEIICGAPTTLAVKGKMMMMMMMMTTMMMIMSFHVQGPVCAYIHQTIGPHEDLLTIV